MLDSYLDTEKIKYVSKTHLPYTFSTHAVSLRYGLCRIVMVPLWIDKSVNLFIFKKYKNS